MNELPAVCGWCGKGVPLRDSGRLKTHFPLEQPKKPCQGSIEFPNDTVIEAKAERLGMAAPQLLLMLTELCDALDAGADSIVIGGLKNQARFAIAAATVRPQS